MSVATSETLCLQCNVDTSFSGTACAEYLVGRLETRAERHQDQCDVDLYPARKIMDQCGLRTHANSWPCFPSIIPLYLKSDRELASDRVGFYRSM